MNKFLVFISDNFLAVLVLLTLIVALIVYERRKGDASSTIADNTLALKTLDWVPIRNLNDMCIDGWRWQENSKRIYL